MKIDFVRPIGPAGDDTVADVDVRASREELDALEAFAESGEEIAIAPARELEAATLPHHVEIDVTVRRYGSRGVRRVRVVEVGDEPVELPDLVAQTMPLEAFESALNGDEGEAHTLNRWPLDGSLEARALIERVLAMYPRAAAQVAGEGDDELIERVRSRLGLVAWADASGLSPLETARGEKLDRLAESFGVRRMGLRRA